MIVRMLGTAAGGGSPQWNCYCEVCTEVRLGAPGAPARTQSSLAFSADGNRWYLVNASPDLRQQLADFSSLARPDSLRETPFAGIILTDAEIDHTAGLLLMRESSVPLHVYSTASVRAALVEHYPVLTMLERYCGVTWTEIVSGEPFVLDERLEVESFPTGGDPPLYIGDALPGMTSVGLTIRDRETGGVLSYAPALEGIDDDTARRFEASDYLAVDGTFWTQDELVAMGLAKRDALAMGHMPLSGPGGSLARLAEFPATTILVHINNTNPILLEGSDERAFVEAAGVRVAVDGMEVRL